MSHARAAWRRSAETKSESSRVRGGFDDGDGTELRVDQVGAAERGPGQLLAEAPDVARRGLDEHLAHGEGAVAGEPVALAGVGKRRLVAAEDEAGDLPAAPGVAGQAGVVALHQLRNGLGGAHRDVDLGVGQPRDIDEPEVAHERPAMPQGDTDAPEHAEALVRWDTHRGGGFLDAEAEHPRNRLERRSPVDDGADAALVDRPVLCGGADDVQRGRIHLHGAAERAGEAVRRFLDEVQLRHMSKLLVAFVRRQGIHGAQ